MTIQHKSDSSIQGNQATKWKYHLQVKPNPHESVIL